MSRHLMARFRHLHAAGGYDWQHGRPLGWSQFAKPYPYATNDPADHVSAIVHHGEQRYGLEVMPSPYGGWHWGIHQYRGEKQDLPEDLDDKYRGEWWNWTSPGEWDHPEGSPAEYSGQADSPADAMKAAQDDWEAHKAHVDAQNPIKGGDYDINDIMRDEGF